MFSRAVSIGNHSEHGLVACGQGEINAGLRTMDFQRQDTGANNGASRARYGALRGIKSFHSGTSEL